jgi:anti-anti-sigma factor
MIIIARENREAQATVLQFIGKIDSQACPELDEALGELLGNSGARVVIDLSRVPQMGSQAIGILVRHFMRTAERRGSQMRLAGMNLMIEQLLRVSGLDKIMPFHATADDALAQMAANPA